jgi:LemA protein
VLPFLVLVAVLVLAGGYVIVTYNGLVKTRNRIENSWSQVDVQLQRRYDLIPNLVETVKAYAAHEESVFAQVTQARAAAIGAKGPAEQAAAENVLTGALRSVFAVAEAYPELQANENFKALQEELSSTEDKIAYARQFYNDTVLAYNTRIQTFPSVFIARSMGFTVREYFEADEGGRGNVKVEF